jgi:putative metalloprotease
MIQRVCITKIFALLGLCLLTCFGCEDTDLRLATEAGVDAVKALALSEDQVMTLSAETAAHLDGKHRIAPPGNPYAVRLERLSAPYREVQGQSFEYRAYMDDTVNAFALGDGTIRVYSGLMDLLDDQELLFVLGHEMGHVLEDHVKEKMQVALAVVALRKGLASQQNIIGDLARSGLGAFGQRLLNAQFSQQEEREADDFGYRFLKRQGHDPTMAVSALNKLATLGSGHSFLSSHPAPGERAKRLQNPDQAGKDTGIISQALDLVKKIAGLGLDVLRWLAGLVF